MKCQFEEKQFEKLMDVELFGLNLFPVGQFFENTIGIDSAGFTHNRNFWRLFRWFPFCFFPPYGIPLAHGLWDLENEINSDAFPSFRCNVFLQYKRPQYISSKSASEYSSWGQNYYRYDINYKQQLILESLEKKVSQDALVLYACPAFWKFSDLWLYRGRLVDRTNFVKAIRLLGHKRYSFIDAGATGMAHSDPEKVEAINLKEEISKFIKQGEHFKRNSDFIFALDDQIAGSLSLLKEIYCLDVDRYWKESKWLFENKLAMSLMRISFFTFVTQLSWMVGCEGSQTEKL